MLFDELEFHNISEVEQSPHLHGAMLHRIPKDVRNQLGEKSLNARGRMISQFATGAEIRFVTEGKRANVRFTLLDNPGHVIVYEGDFRKEVCYLEKGVVHSIEIEESPHFSTVNIGDANMGRFSPKVWRLLFNRNRVVFHGIESYGYAIRPPKSNEVPSVKWLAYGSSITMGAGAYLNSNSYLQVAAQSLGVDVYNKGLGGSCLCEPEMADYLAEQQGWDFMTLELGINMRGLFTPEEFESRAEQLIRKITTAHPQKPVIIMTVFPNHATWQPNGELAKKDQAYNKSLREICSRMESPCLHLIEGNEVLRDPSYLTSDWVHPSDFGHISMGQHLAGKLKSILGGTS